MRKKEKRPPRSVVYSLVEPSMLAMIDVIAEDRTWSRGVTVRQLLSEALAARAAAGR